MLLLSHFSRDFAPQILFILCLMQVIQIKFVFLGKLPTYNFLSFDFGGSTNGLENVLSEEDISDQESYDESNGSASEELSEKSSAPKTLNSQILAETLKRCVHMFLFLFISSRVAES